LEVGSGLGILASEVGLELPRGGIVGIEFLDQQIGAAPRNPSNLTFVRGDAHSLPFPDNSFDVVYCRYVLEHVADPVRALKEMRRVLRTGGRAYVQENNDAATDWYPECPRYAAVWQRFIELQRQLGGDPLIGKKLFSLFIDAGFEDIKLSIQPEVHWPGCTGFEIWVANMAALIRGASEELVKRELSKSVEIDAAICEIEEFSKQAGATALFYWNRAAAVK
jgi:ubiquinone/menaquinone biosynthesis C-methylase UbiE